MSVNTSGRCLEPKIYVALSFTSSSMYSTPISRKKKQASSRSLRLTAFMFNLMNGANRMFFIYFRSDRSDRSDHKKTINRYDSSTIFVQRNNHSDLGRQQQRGLTIGLMSRDNRFERAF